MRLGRIAKNIRAKLVIVFLAAALPLIGVQVMDAILDRAEDVRVSDERRLGMARLIAKDLSAFVRELSEESAKHASAVCSLASKRADMSQRTTGMYDANRVAIHTSLSPTTASRYPLKPCHAGRPIVLDKINSDKPREAIRILTPLRSRDGGESLFTISVGREALQRRISADRLIEPGAVCVLVDSARVPGFIVLARNDDPSVAQREMRTWLRRNQKWRGGGYRRCGPGSAAASVAGTGWTLIVRDPSGGNIWSILRDIRADWTVAALLVGGAILCLAGGKIGQRARRLALAASAIAVGDYRKRVKMGTGDELEMLAKALNSVGERLVRDQNAMKRHADLLAKMAEAARISSSSLDIRECARAVAKAVCLQLGARDSAVFRKRASVGEVRVLGFCGRRCRSSWKLVASHTIASGDYLVMSEKVTGDGRLADSQGVLVGIPLRHDDVVFGAIVARYEGGIKKNDLKLGSMRADLLQTFGIHAAAAISNAEAHSETERASEALKDSVDRLSSVVLVTDAIAPSLTIEETLNALARTTATLLDVDLCTIYLPEQNGQLVAKGCSADIEAIRSIGPLPPGQCETSKAFSARRSVICTDTQKSKYALTRNRCEASGVRSIMSTPLVGDGSAFGAIAVYTREPRRFSPRDVDLLESISHHAAFIVRNASLYTKEYSIAESLQRSLISDTPEECRGLRFAARYIPVADEARLGGDFYEVVELPNGRIGVLIADVSGKGLAAAMHLAACKFMMKAFMFAHPDDPGAVLSELNDAVNYYFDLSFFVTMFYCVIDPNEGTLVYASAGHLPALLVSLEGKVHRTLTGAGIPVGSGHRCHYEVRSTTIRPDDNLVLYTDGVTDVVKNGAPLDIEGLHKLVFEAGPSSASQLVDHICRHLTCGGDSSRKDDIALMVVSFDGVSASHNAAVGGSKN